MTTQTTPVFNTNNLSLAEAREEAQYLLQRYSDSLVSIGEGSETDAWYKEYQEMDAIADRLLEEMLA